MFDKLLFTCVYVCAYINIQHSFLCCHFSCFFLPISLSHVCVSMKIMEKLLSELTTDRRQLLAKRFLDMVHDLLHANQLFYHNLAAKSVRTNHYP